MPFFYLLVLSFFFASLSFAQFEEMQPHPKKANVFIKVLRNEDGSIIKKSEYLRIPLNVGIRQNNGKPQTPTHKDVLLEQATLEDLKKSLGNDKGLKEITKETVKLFPADFAKFNAAMTLVEMTACYGGGFISHANFQTSTDSPICVDNLIYALTSLEGNLGFFSFMIANRITSKHLTNLAIVTSQAMTSGVKTPAHIQAIRPYIGYVGMAMGAMASQMISQIMSIPTFRNCAKDVIYGNPGSINCRQTATHFLSAEQFWLDFGAHLPSLIGGAILAGKTHWFLKNSLRVIAPAGIEVAKALKNVKSLSTTVLTISSIFAGPAVVVVRLGTAVGEVVFFLAWSKILEVPTTRAMWMLYDAPKIYNLTNQFQNTVDSLAEAGGFAKKSVDLSCPPKTPRAMTLGPCKSIEYVSHSLMNLRHHASRYRQKVTLAKFNKSYAEWNAKIETYINHYMAAKILLELAYEQRQIVGASKLPLLNVATAVDYFWTEVLLGYIPPADEYLKYELVEIQLLMEAVRGQFKVDNKTPETALAQKLVEFKKKVYADYNYSVGEVCDLDVRRCNALAATALIPDSAEQLKDAEIISENPRPVFHNLRTNDFAQNSMNLHLLSKSLPVQQVIRQLICDGSKNVETWYTSLLSGRAAAIQFPRIVEKPDKSLKDTCKYYGITEDAQPKLKSEEEGMDIQKVWLANKKSYLDPLSLLSDSTIPLILGNSEREAKVWWNKNLLPQALTFQVDFIKGYKKMIEDNLFSKIKKSALDKSNVSSSYLNESLVSEMNLVLSALKKLSPILSKQPDKIQKEADKILELYEKHLISFKYSESFPQLDEVLRKRIQLVLENPEKTDLNEFAKQFRKTVFAEDHKLMNDRYEELRNKVNKLGLPLIGQDLGDIKDPKENEKILNLSAKEVASLSPEAYKKYISLQFLQHLRLLLVESLDYYDNYLYHNGFFDFSEQT